MQKLNEQKKRLHEKKVPFFLLAFIILQGLIPTAGFALAPPTLPQTPVAPRNIQPEQMGLVACSVNGVAFGDIEVGIYGDEPIFSRDVLSGILMEYLNPDVYNTIFNVVFADLMWIGRDDLSLVGIQSDWDIVHVTISLKVPPSYSGITDIDIAPQYVANIKPIFKPSPVSGHLDFRASVDVDISKTNVAVPLELTISGTVNILDWIAEASEDMRISDSDFSSSLSTIHVIHDIPKINGRLFIGRVSTSGLSYQSQPELYGISLRSEEIIRYKVKPGFYELFSEFTIETPSTVRIKLNNMTYRTITLNPGNYRLLDLPFTYGLNDFVLEIEDASGNITRKRASIPREMNLLDDGLSDYAFSAGVGRVELSEPFGSAYFRHGFSPRFTAGATGQIDLRSTLLGASFVFASPFGSFTGSANTVVAWDGRENPWSGAGSLQYRLVFPGNDFIPSLGLSIEYISEGFAAPAPTATLAAMEETLRLGAQIGGKLAKYTSYSVSSYWTKTYGAGGSEATTASVSINQGLGTGASISLISNATFSPGEAPDFSATLMLFVLPREEAGKSLSFIQSGDGTNSISFVDRVDELGGVDINLRGSNLMPGADEGSSVGLGARKTSQWGDIDFNADFDYANPLSTNIGQIQLAANSSLAFAGGYFAITRPIDDSFVLFAPSKDMAGQKVYLRVEGAETIVSSNGRPVILPITSYRSAVAYMDLPEAPPDMLPRIQAALLTPTYKSGIAYASDILRRYKVSGRLVDGDGKPIGYIAGDIVDLGGTNLASTFTDENGDFEIYDLVPGSYIIQWPDFVGTTAFEVVESPEGSVILGTIVAGQGK